MALENRFSRHDGGLQEGYGSEGERLALVLTHHKTRQDLHIASILCIILVVGFILPGGLNVPAHHLAGLPFFALITEPEAMETAFNAMDRWLLELGFFLDPDLGRVRNPFDFLRGEADPSLRECSIDLNRTPGLILGAAGAGKTAQLRLFVQEHVPQCPIHYQSVIALNAVLDDVWHMPKVKANLERHQSAHIVLDVEDNDTLDSQVVALLLQRIYANRIPHAIHFHIALPERFRSVADGYKTWAINWHPDQLAELLSLRLIWASQGRLTNLDQICDTGVTNLHATLSNLAETPRRLFELGQFLFRHHVANDPLNERLLLQESDQQALLAHVSSAPAAIRPPAVSPIEKDQPASSATSPQEAIRQAEITLVEKLSDLNLHEYKTLVMAWRVLEKLETQCAGYTSLDIPPSRKIELEDKRSEVAELFKKAIAVGHPTIDDEVIQKLKPEEKESFLLELLRQLFEHHRQAEETAVSSKSRQTRH